MKFIKRLFIVVIILSLSFVLVIKNNVSATVRTITNKDKTTEWQIESETIKNIGGMTQIEVYGKSKSTTASSCNTWGNQHVNILEFKTDGVNSKLVSWGIQTGSKGLTFASLTNIAKDYEKNHPGWIVVGGVNGDQYYMSYGNRKGEDGSWYNYPIPYYPLKIEGEARYPITPYNVSASNYLGVLNNGEVNSFAQPSEVTTLKLEIIDADGNVLYTYDVDHFNEHPTGNEVSVWSSYPNPNTTQQNASTTYPKMEVTSTANLYIVEEPELAIVTNYQAKMDASVRDCFFGRGVISKIDSTYTFGGNYNKQDEYSKVNGFGIETTNTEITSKLTVNTRIRVQYYYENEELNECESFMNYHSVQIANGKSVLADQGYDSNRYNRSGWGRKADGTYVLFTGAKGNYAGLSQDETNTLLLDYGVVEAYQQDGGGSSMCIVRNMETGEFDLVQPSSDGLGTGQRSVAEACLFVVRDPSIQVTKSKTTYHSVTFDKKDNFAVDVSNIQIKVNGKTYDFTDTCVIDGLDPETTYDYTIEFDFKNGDETVRGSYSAQFTTNKMEFPMNIVKEGDVSINQAEFIIDDTKAQNIQIHINDETFTYTPNDDKKLIVTGLQREETYLYTYTFDVINEYNGKTYTYTSNDESITTTDFEIPVIKKFELEKTETDYVRVAYTYTDPDKVVTKAYVICGNDIYDLTIKSDSVKVTDLDLAHKEYQIQLTIEYKDKKITSDIITVGTNNPVVDEPTSSGCTSAVVAYIIASIMCVSIVYYKKH